MMAKYYCPSCGKKELRKMVYTEESCDNCGDVDYHPHKKREKELKP